MTAALSSRPAVPGQGTVAQGLPVNVRTVTLGDLVGQGLEAGARTVTLGDLMDRSLAAGTPTVTVGAQAGQGLPAGEAQRISQLAQLGQLHRQGVLTDSEFEAQKAEVLGE